MLGLDRLAAQKKKEKELLENQSHKSDEPTSKRSKTFSYKSGEEAEDIESRTPTSHSRSDDDNKSRNYRERDHEDKKTPTPHRTYHDKISKDRNGQHEKKGLYASTNKYAKDRRDDNRKHRKDWEEYTPTHKSHSDYSRTPSSSKIKDTPSRSGWEDEDHYGERKRSNWDINTPKTHGKHDDGQSSYRRKQDATPAPTPSHKYNKWADDRKKTGATPSAKKEASNFSDEEDYEDDQKRLDREWYGMDENEGFDQDNNSFASMSEQFLSNKTQNLQQQWKRKVSFHQQQRNRDVEKWETNRMLQSGVVSQLDPDEDMEEEFEARVHITVHHIVPPFLDGRITFTKQFEPVIPLKDPTSDMAIICRKGMFLILKYIICQFIHLFT